MSHILGMSTRFKVPIRDVVDSKSRGCHKLKSGNSIIRRSYLYDDRMSSDNVWLTTTLDVNMWSRLHDLPANTAHTHERRGLPQMPSLQARVLLYLYYCCVALIALLSL